MGKSELERRCACCGEYVLPPHAVYEICPVCGWEDDDVQNDDPTFAGGANSMSLEQARKAYIEKKAAKNQ